MDYIKENRHISRAADYVKQKVSNNISVILPAIAGIGAIAALFLAPGSARSITLTGVSAVAGAAGISTLLGIGRRVEEDADDGLRSFELSALSPTKEEIEERIGEGKKGGLLLRGRISGEKLFKGLRGLYRSSRQGALPTVVAAALLVGALACAGFGSPILHHLHALTSKVSWLPNSNLLALGVVTVGGVGLSVLMDRVLKRERSVSMPLSLTSWAQKAWSYLPSRNRPARGHTPSLIMEKIPASPQTNEEVMKTDL